jgi:ethanolamine utilization microcompartment shell protein EutS
MHLAFDLIISTLSILKSGSFQVGYVNRFKISLTKNGNFYSVGLVVDSKSYGNLHKPDGFSTCKNVNHLFEIVRL